MKMKSVLFIAGFLILSLSTWAQTESSDLVKRNYPQIYSSIAQSAEKQWGNDNKMKQVVIEGQAKAFLDIAEAKNVNNSILTDAILNNSLSGAKDSNAKILSESSDKDSFSRLQCDWYKVKTYYDREVKNPVVSEATSTRSYSSNPFSTPKTVTENQTAPQKTDYQTTTILEEVEPMTQSEDSENYLTEEAPLSRYSRTEVKVGRHRPQTPPFNFGIKVGGGMGTFLDATEYDGYSVKITPSIALEAGIVSIYRTKGFFLQNETSALYTKSSFKETSTYYNDDFKFKVDHLYINTAIHFGGYAEIGDNVRFMAGIGPFASGRIKSTAKYEDDDKETIDEGIKNFNLGVSAIIGVDMNRVRVGLYPSMGLTKIYDGNDAKTFNLMLGVTCWIF